LNLNLKGKSTEQHHDFIVVKLDVKLAKKIKIRVRNGKKPKATLV
jgi:hypothetical protein